MTLHDLAIYLLVKTGVRGERNYEKKLNLALLDLIEAQIHFYLLYTLYLY